MFVTDSLSNFLTNETWEPIIETTSTNSYTKTVDISVYSFLSLELCYVEEIIAQVTVPAVRYSSLRCVSGFVDAKANIAIANIHFSSSTSVTAYVSQQVNNAVKVRLRGIKRINS